MLLRIWLSGVTNWFQPEPDIRDLAQKLFPDDGPTSVFQVEAGRWLGFRFLRRTNHVVRTGSEETAVAAAHWSTLKRNNVGPVTAVRLCESEVSGSGVIIVRQSGETGVPEVDALHLDLTATQAQAERVAALVRGGIERGEDRLRRVEALQIRLALERFLSLDGRQALETFARQRCQKALGL